MVDRIDTCQGKQSCQFNDCSTTLFNVDKMNPYYKKYDSGNNATPKAPVKSFVEEPSNLKLGSQYTKIQVILHHIVMIITICGHLFI